MPTHKDFKRLIRGRMQKTGESYTAARAQLLKKRHDPRPVAYAKLAGMSDASVKAKTGCTWERWVRALDRVQAHEWPHRKIVSYVHAKYKTPDWWAQMVTVGYERIRGLRDIGQRRDGSFRAGRSRTFPVSVSRLFQAFSDARTRRHWLPGVELTIRTAIADRSARVTWKDGTSVEAYFTPKGGAKSQLAVQHEKLRSKEAAAQMKQYWGERLDALVGVLADSSSSSAEPAPVDRAGGAGQAKTACPASPPGLSPTPAPPQSAPTARFSSTLNGLFSTSLKRGTHPGVPS